MDVMRFARCYLALWAAFGVFVADWVQRSDLRQATTPVALCPNYDTLIIFRTPWEYANGRKTQRIPAPPCLTLTEARALRDAD